MKTKFLIPLLAGLGLLCACKGKTGYEIANYKSANADTVKTDSVTASQPKLIKTAGMHFKVKNVQKTTDQIIALTKGCNGFIIHHEMGSTAQRSLDIRISDDSVMRVTAFATVADITVKIPEEKLEDFMNRIALMGLYVNNRTMDITDKSLDYLSSQLKLKNRSEMISQQKAGNIIIRKPEDVLQLRDDMIDQQINNLGINNSVKNSVVTLSFYESDTIKKETIANDDPSAYNLAFFRRLGMAVQNGWEIFVGVIVGLANLWVFILIGLVVWFIIRHYKVKKPVVNC